jgi:Fic family protein
MPYKANKPFNQLPELPPLRNQIETLNVLRQLVRSSVAVAELKGMTNALPNSKILLNAVILREARASSEIENVITTHDKLYQALSVKGSAPDAATKEVLRYREAILYGFQFIQQKGYMNTNTIIAIQKLLEENNAGIRKLPGTALRSAATNQVIYTPPDEHETILRLMKNLEDYLNEQDDISPLIKMAVQHYQFESIHPFYDGNGRTGRIINILYLILHRQLDEPVLYLSDYIIRTKPDYYRLLQQVRTAGDWESWILYLLKAVEVTARETCERIKSIQKLFQSTLEKIQKEAAAGYDKELVEVLFEQPYCKTEMIVTRLGVSRLTASKYLKQLEATGILKSKKIWKETLYINTRLFELLKK